HHRNHPSFPTRRSSDLEEHARYELIDGDLVKIKEGTQQSSLDVSRNYLAALAFSNGGKTLTCGSPVNIPGHVLAVNAGAKSAFIDRKSTRLNSSHDQIS